MTKPRLLLVEDDRALADLLIWHFSREGYDIVRTADGDEALILAEERTPDLVILDWMIEGVSGIEVCRRLRRRPSTASVPIIMLTARGEETDRIRGLDTGADDYVTKPFSAKQLIARIKAVIRRCQGDPYRQPVSELRAGDLVLDLQSHEARKDGTVVQLTPLEFRLLYMLAMNEGRVIPYDRLVEYAWGYDGGDSSLLKTHMSHIRSKLGIGAAGPGSIRAIPGVGYSLGRS